MKDILLEKYGDITPVIKCLNSGYVQLLDCMPRSIEDKETTADYSIAESARCSYQRGTKTINDDKVLIRYLMRHNHTSPFEMIEFKFKIKLPIFIARQMIRHRTVSVNELSGRYSELPEEFYVPEIDNIRMQSKTNTQGSEGFVDEDLAMEVKKSTEDSAYSSFDLYHDLLNNGVVREQSRIILPLSTYTEWYWKINLKNLLHFLDLRCDSHSQLEMQEYGNAILKLISPIVPWTIEAWEDYSPYRGGMILTMYEVEKIKSMMACFSSCSPIGEKMLTRSIDTGSKLENKEWITKATKLGFNHGFFTQDE